MDGADRELFERSLRHAVGSGTGDGHVSAHDVAGDLAHHVALDGALDELGWHQALEHDPRTAVSVLFELHGSADAHSSALHAVLGHGLGAASLPAGTLLLPPPGPADPPGTLAGGILCVRGLATGPPAEAVPGLVVTRTGDADVVVEVAAGELARRPVDGMAPHLGFTEVTGTDVAHTVRCDLAAGDWDRAVALARLAVGHELVGASKRMLELARQHALERVQFDRPISAFQAVRHRLADTLVAVEAGDAALRSAWDERSPESAAMAKALAGRAALTAARHCQQVLAGIGFTTEHEFHRSVRRVLVIDELYGSARSLTRELGRELLATGQLPALPPL